MTLKHFIPNLHGVTLDSYEQDSQCLLLEQAMKLGEMQRYICSAVQINWETNTQRELMIPLADGPYVLFSDAQAKSLADERRIQELEKALRYIGEYEGEGPSTTPWQEIVAHLGAKAHSALREDEP